jgi:hypothetical protein
VIEDDEGIRDAAQDAFDPLRLLRRPLRRPPGTQSLLPSSKRHFLGPRRFDLRQLGGRERRPPRPEPRFTHPPDGDPGQAEQHCPQLSGGRGQREREVRFDEQVERRDETEKGGQQGGTESQEVGDDEDRGEQRDERQIRAQPRQQQHSKHDADADGGNGAEVRQQRSS